MSKIAEVQPVLLTTLLELLNIESFSGKEKEAIDYVTTYLEGIGFIVKIDEIGNVYATRGESDAYPLLNAHLDSVKGYSNKRNNSANCRDCAFYYGEYKQYDKKYNYDRTYIKCSMYTGDIFPYSAYTCPSFYSVIAEEEEESQELVATYNPKTKVIKGNGTRPIGGDDKCGVAIALEIARTTHIPLKILFNVQEEIGCKGSTYTLEKYSDWLKDCAYGITIDRRGSNHICVTTGGERNANNYFIGELAKWAIITGIAPSWERGSMSDNYVLKKVVPNFVNVSAGYTSAHSCTETVNYEDVKRIKKWIENFITKGDFVEK